MNEFYTDYAEYMARFFPGMKVQKLSLNTGNGCPNRDGTIGTGGCIYCNNRSFTPAYCFGVKGIREQLEAGKRFFGRKYPKMKYIAYFQSYSGTYGMTADLFDTRMREALSTEDVLGVAIGTRPDCLPDEMVDVLHRYAEEYPVFLELGVESMHDSTLRLINRGHDSSAVVDAVNRCSDAGMHVGVHLIAGLPGETREMMLRSVRDVCRLPIESIKLHQLQILAGTTLHKMWLEGDIDPELFTFEDYLDFCSEVIGLVPRDIAIERFVASAPPDMVVAPKWGVKNYEFTTRLLNGMRADRR